MPIVLYSQYYSIAAPQLPGFPTDRNLKRIVHFSFLFDLSLQNFILYLSFYTQFHESHTSRTCDWEWRLVSRMFDWPVTSYWMLYLSLVSIVYSAVKTLAIKFFAYLQREVLGSFR